MKRFHVSKNLFSIDFTHDDYSTLVYHYTISGLTPNNQYTCSSNFVQSGSSASIWFGGTSTGTNGVSDGNPKTMTSNANGEIDFYINHNTGNAYSQVVNGTAWVMVNEGSTALPYEPYGNTWQTKSPLKYGTSTDTLTTLPDDLYADGTAATVGFVGNMSQTGTPTPQNPIQPSETGERTGNLFDISTVTLGKYINSQGQEVESTASANISKLNHTDYISVISGEPYIYNYEKGVAVSNTIALCWFDAQKLIISRDTLNVTTDTYSISATAPNNAKYCIINFTGYPVSNSCLTFNRGSTALPYEPHGYKIPISSANTTTPVYLGQVESTRQIKKLVLTGEESITRSGAISNCYYISVSDYLYARATKIAICTHYEVQANVNGAAEMIDKRLSFYANQGTISHIMYIRDASFATKEDLASYLAAQYAAGTPVTVWYVLAEPTTGIVNEPLRKIGDYADTVSGISIPTITGKDTFDVETTLKPSEVSLAYTGWHDASVKEWDGSEWQ